jgi:ribosome-associated toxin RatA of RatAB toxin-antitoxin module
LVADVERYVEFVPWWIAVKVQHWQEDTVYVEQVIGRGAVRRRMFREQYLNVLTG